MTIKERIAGALRAHGVGDECRVDWTRADRLADVLLSLRGIAIVALPDYDAPLPERPNRLVVVDESGRVYDRTGVSVELSEQDDGLTLKVFISPTTESAEERARHLTRLSEDMKLYNDTLSPH
jgi:hypothetical protein